jgi:hypothetical protein
MLMWLTPQKGPAVLRQEPMAQALPLPLDADFGLSAVAREQL